MTNETYIPTDLLRPFIKTYRIIGSQDEVVNRVFPETAHVLVFRIQGQVNYLSGNTNEKLPNFVLTGLKKSVRLINYNQNSANIIVIFKEAGATAFFKEPMHELFEVSASLENFIQCSEVDRIEERLVLAKDNNHRIEIIEQFILSKLHNHIPDQLIQSALQKIHTSRGLYPINNLASSLHISQDAFEKRFRKLVGASPKQFSTIIRMRNVIAEKKQTKSLTEIALDAGFYDQSHFNKDFKIFTGLTPSDFFKSTPLW
jgi:AraC-like DNA-binding protein